jgi:hypothetical protein
LVYGAVKDLLAEQAIHEDLMRAYDHFVPVDSDQRGELNAYIRAVDAWYGRSLCIAVRRLVDNRKDVVSAVTMLAELKRGQLRDIHGRRFDRDAIDVDIDRLRTMTQAPCRIANNYLAHRSERTPPTMPPPLALGMPTFREFKDIATDLDETVYRYVSRIYDGGIEEPGLRAADKRMKRLPEILGFAAAR